jgi:putative addiction module component (TIGR02574 family)
MPDIKEILQLSTAERILIIEKIWDSIDHKEISVSTLQKEELDRRLKRYRSGETKFSTWQEVKEELHRSK